LIRTSFGAYARVEGSCVLNKVVATKYLPVEAYLAFWKHLEGERTIEEIIQK
jgi:hypothetical protein